MRQQLLFPEPVNDYIFVEGRTIVFQIRFPCNFSLENAPVTITTHQTRPPSAHPKTSHQHKSTYKISGKRDVARNTSLTCCHETFVRISNNLCQSLDSDSLINRAASQCVDNLTVNFITSSMLHMTHSSHCFSTTVNPSFCHNTPFHHFTLTPEGEY